MITFLYAGILGLIYAALSLYTIKGRFKYRLLFGNGGKEGMTRRVRAHGNFSEYIPFILILMMFSEPVLAGNLILIHIAGIALVASRIVYSLSVLELAKIPFGRQIGMVTTLLMLIIFSMIAIYSFGGEYISVNFDDMFVYQKMLSYCDELNA